MENFDKLTPDLIWHSVEKALGKQLTGYISTFTSYINRVYELETVEGERIVAKFYRPGRWHYEAICDEHDFMFECVDNEIPVIAPFILSDGSSIGECEGLYFSVYSKMSGRQYELNTDVDWMKTGRLLGRLHNIGANEVAPDRIELHPETSLIDDIDHLLVNDFVPKHFQKSLKTVTDELFKLTMPLFADVNGLRVHGDAHLSNFIDRLDGNVYMIDFDDMMMGPAVQDMWLILPDHIDSCTKEINLLLEGYESFRPFNRKELALIEPLRAMRMIYFTSWCASQINDNNFGKNFPNWGNDNFWRKEVNDLQLQIDKIKGLDTTILF